MAYLKQWSPRSAKPLVLKLPPLLDGPGRALGEDARACVVRPDAYDVAYLDPPYREEVAARVLVNLGNGGWLAPGALCVVELHRKAPFAAPEGFVPVDERTWGDTRIVFLTFAGG